MKVRQKQAPKPRRAPEKQSIFVFLMRAKIVASTRLDLEHARPCLHIQYPRYYGAPESGVPEDFERDSQKAS